MIRHAFLGRVGGRYSLAESVGALTVAMIEAAFQTLLVAAASSTELLQTRKPSAISAAIKLASVAVGADEEERAAMRSLAKSLTENGLCGSRQEHNQRAMDERIPLRAT